MTSQDVTMFCLVCGGPMLEPFAQACKENPWLGKATLLAENRGEESSITESSAVNTGGPTFQLVHAGGERVTACEIHHPLMKPKPLTYLACHTECVSLAKRLISSRTTIGARQRELFYHVWQVLLARFQKSAAGRRVPVHKVYEPNGYHGAFKFQEMEWEPGSTPERRYESEHFEADPINIPDLTSSVLSQLRSIPTSSDTETVHPSSSRAPLIPDSTPLPPELLSNILQQLSPFSDPPQQCTYKLAPSHWRTGLLQGTILPWLWNLDVELVAEKERSLENGHEGVDDNWDWEQLTRKLARTAIHQPGKVFDDLPLGLRNRRRIWKLIDDILSSETA